MMRKTFILFFVLIVAYGIALPQGFAATLQRPANILTFQNGLAGWWTFDGKDMIQNVTDSSGQGNTGYLQGQTSTTTVLGKIGQALKFDGVNDYVNVGTVSSLNITGAITISVWVKTVTSGTNDVVFTKGPIGATPATEQYNLLFSGFATPKFTISNGTTRLISVAPANSVPNGEWKHVVGTYNGSDTTKLYIDGIQVDSDTTESFGAINSVSGVPTIGSYPGGLAPAAFIVGSLDDVRVYSRVLSADEIRQLYNTSASRFGVTSAASDRLKNGLVAWYTFDGKDINWATGQVVDRSGTGNIGQVTNLSTTTSIAGGIVGQGIDFKTSTGYVRAAPAANINTMSTMTVCAWVKPRSYGGKGDGLDYGTFLDKSTDAVNGGWNFCFDNLSHGPSLSVAHSVTAVYRASSQAIPLNTWTHVCATYDGGSAYSGIHLFQNGAEVTTTAAQTHDGEGIRSSDDTNTLKVGNTLDFTGLFDGIIDEARVYNRILSSSEIKEIYNATSPSHANVTSAGPESLKNGLVAWYTFDGKDMPAGYVLDKSGNGHHGTITGMSTSTMYVLGRLGQALRFPNETNAGVTMTPFASMDSYTYAYWLYHDQELGWGTAVAVDTNTALYIIGSAQPSVRKLDYWFAGDDHISTGAVTPNEWHHIALTATAGATGTFYIDGVPAGTIASPPASGAIDQLGHTNAVNEGLRGAMDDFRIYNRELSATEVMQLYKMGR